MVLIGFALHQDMSFLNSEARGSYINIVAGSLGFVGAGATTAVSQLVARGVNVGAVLIILQTIKATSTSS